MKEGDVENNLPDEEMAMIEEEQEIIIKTFENVDYEYPVIDIIQELKNGGHPDAREIILNAIGDNLLNVGGIEDDGTVYVALSQEGINAWKRYNEKKVENKEE